MLVLSWDEWDRQGRCGESIYSVKLNNGLRGFVSHWEVPSEDAGC